MKIFKKIHVLIFVKQFVCIRGKKSPLEQTL